MNFLKEETSPKKLSSYPTIPPLLLPCSVHETSHHIPFWHAAFYRDWKALSGGKICSLNPISHKNDCTKWCSCYFPKIKHVISQSPWEQCHNFFYKLKKCYLSKEVVSYETKPPETGRITKSDGLCLILIYKVVSSVIPI